MAGLRDTGFRAYVDELQARKMAELREKILRAMGLTEEDLKDMDAQRRAEIEKLVARRIRELLLGTAALDEETEGDGTAGDGIGGDGTDGDGVAARLLAAAGGLGAGPALLQVVEQAQAAEAERSADGAANGPADPDPAAGRNDPA